MQRFVALAIEIDVKIPILDNNLKCSKRSLQVPIDYEVPHSTGYMSLHVKKIAPNLEIDGKIKRVVVGISGGPGQTGYPLEMAFPLNLWLKNDLMKDTMFISADFRFTGKSDWYFI